MKVDIVRKPTHADENIERFVKFLIRTEPASELLPKPERAFRKGVLGLEEIQA